MSPVFTAQMKAAENAEAVRESNLLYGKDHDGMFGIYQVKDGEALRNVRFAPLTVRDTLTNLNKIYSAFQGETPACPADYAGRSVSTGDVIVQQWRGEVSAHYVDSYKFSGLSSFTGNETPREQSPQTYSQLGNTPEQAPPAAPEYTGPSVADFEAEAKAGRPISLTGLARAVHAQRPSQKEKPSLLGRLEISNARAAAQSPGAAPTHTTTNREV
jgi:hypothetical protein